MPATLVTGATGFVGATLVSELLSRDEPARTVAVLARGADPRTRVEAALRRVDAPCTGRLEVVAGDLTAPGLGVDARTRDRLHAEVDTIVHSGAAIRFDLPLEQARAINVGGTASVLELCERVDRRTGAPPHLVHVSTAFVAGRRSGTAREDELDVRADFRNSYERTKAEAEALVGRAGVPAAIARPSIVVGEARSGWTAAFNVLYWPLRAWTRGLLDPVPATPGGIVDSVGIDTVVAGLLALHDDRAARGAYTLAAGADAVTVGELAAAAAAATGRPPPRYGPADLGDTGAVFLPYFDVATRFATARGDALLGEPAPRLTAALPRLLDFAQRARWGKVAISRAEARAA